MDGSSSRLSSFPMTKMRESEERSEISMKNRLDRIRIGSNSIQFNRNVFFSIRELTYRGYKKYFHGKLTYLYSSRVEGTGSTTYLLYKISYKTTCMRTCIRYMCRGNTGIDLWFHLKKNKVDLRIHTSIYGMQPCTTVVRSLQRLHESKFTDSRYFTTIF